MIMAWIGAIAATLSLIVTIIGWYVTGSKQEALAETQGEIQKKIYEHDTRFEYLHKRRVEVMDKLYKQLDKIIQLLLMSARAIRFVGERSPDEQRDEAINLMGPFIEYYSQNRLYVDRSLRDEIERIIKQLTELGFDTGSANFFSRWEYDASIRSQAVELRKKVQRTITEELPPIRDVIENEMRKVLGFDWI